jgi:hypothetical protein
MSNRLPLGPPALDSYNLTILANILANSYHFFPPQALTCLFGHGGDQYPRSRLLWDWAGAIYMLPIRTNTLKYTQIHTAA